MEGLGGELWLSVKQRYETLCLTIYITIRILALRLPTYLTQLFSK